MLQATGEAACFWNSSMTRVNTVDCDEKEAAQGQNFLICVISD